MSSALRNGAFVFTVACKGRSEMWDPRTYVDTDYGLEEGETFEPQEDLQATESVPVSGPHVMTVLGPILPEELGICLPHTHLLADPPDANEDARLTDADLAEAEIEAYVTVNGRSLVEATTADMGRLIPALLEIAGWVPVHIVAATGRQHDRFARLMPNALDADALAAEFARDLAIGMDETSARAGAIHVGIGGEAPSEAEAAVIAAAARAHRESGVTVLLQAGSPEAARSGLQALSEHGVGGNRVVVGGIDGKSGVESDLRSILDAGAYLQFDQIGTTDDYTDQDRAELIASLIESGYANQLLLALDYDRRSLQTAWDGAPGLAYLSEWFMVTLRQVGVPAQTIRHLVVDKSSRALTIIPPILANGTSTDEG